MTPEEEPLDLEALARFREEHRTYLREYEADLETTSAALDRMVCLLAWLFKQKRRPDPLDDAASWPGVWPMDWPILRDLVFVDPLVFDLARYQAATDLIEEPTRPLDLAQEVALSANAARLLRSNRPNPGQGSKPGEAAIRALVAALWAELREWNVWGLNERRTKPEDPQSVDPTANAFAEALADRLNMHPLLKNTSGVVLSPEAIRALF